MRQSSSLKNRKQKNSQNKTILFGKHLTIDAYGCNEKVLNDLEANFRVLHELPKIIAMRAITTPHVVKVGPNNKKDCGGISGFVMIAESHIALHTFPAKQYLTMDVYSCTMFNENTVIKYLKQFYGFKRLEKHIIKRGLKFPKNNLVEL